MKFEGSANDSITLPQAMRAKGRLWLLALHRQIEAVWLAQRVSLEAVVIETMFALTAVRAMDLEVLERTGGKPYRDLRRTVREGRVVSGLTLMRNTGLHLPILVEPDYLSSGFASNRTTWRRWDPTWKLYADLPSEVRAHVRTASRCHEDYAFEVEGLPVMESLLDAAFFFHRAVPSLVPHGPGGGMLHFPLDGSWLPGIEYERLHPHDKPRSQVARELFEQIYGVPPCGDERLVQFREELRRRSGVASTVFGGVAVGVEPNSPKWVEAEEGLISDVRLGYPYRARIGKDRVDLHLQDGVLFAAEKRLDDVPLPPFPRMEDWFLQVEAMDNPWSHGVCRGRRPG